MLISSREAADYGERLRRAPVLGFIAKGAPQAFPAQLKKARTAPSETGQAET